MSDQSFDQMTTQPEHFLSFETPWGRVFVEYKGNNPLLKEQKDYLSGHAIKEVEKRWPEFKENYISSKVGEVLPEDDDGWARWFIASLKDKPLFKVGR